MNQKEIQKCILTSKVENDLAKRIAKKYYYDYDTFGEKCYFLGDEEIPIRLISNDILPLIKFKPLKQEVDSLKQVRTNLKRKLEYVINRIENIEDNEVRIKSQKV